MENFYQNIDFLNEDIRGTGRSWVDLACKMVRNGLLNGYDFAFLWFTTNFVADDINIVIT